MAVGLQERLLGQVLRVVMIADPVVGVAVDVAQVSTVEIGELRIELCLGLLADLLADLLTHSSHTTLAPIGSRSRGARELALGGRSRELRRWSLGTAEPVPLQADAGPDALGDRHGEAGRGLLHRGEAQSATDADAYLARAHPPAAADVLGAEYRDRHHGHAGLERQATHPAVRIAKRSGTRAGALGEDHDAVTPLENRAGGIQRVSIAGAAVDRKRAETVQQPCLPALFEQLALGHVVDG